LPLNNLETERVDKKYEKEQPKCRISEVYFGYNTILAVYPQLTTDTNELCEIMLNEETYGPKL